VGLPAERCGLECEICAVYRALHGVVGNRPITIFVDGLLVLERLIIIIIIIHYTYIARRL